MPADPNGATLAIIQAFHDAYDGGTPPRRREASMQDGAALAPLRVAAREFGLARGFSEDQLDGVAVAVSQVEFVDRSHAIVRFTLTIPGLGAAFTDRIGYAVFDDGRWKVSVRTACDVLSMSGAVHECPPGTG